LKLYTKICKYDIIIIIYVFFGNYLFKVPELKCFTTDKDQQHIITDLPLAEIFSSNFRQNPSQTITDPFVKVSNSPCILLSLPILLSKQMLLTTTSFFYTNAEMC
jgi:hypothetical protein